MRDTHGHDWFGRVCRRCGTTSDRHNAVRRCEPPPVDQSVFTPADAATFVSAFDTSSYDSTPAPEPWQWWCPMTNPKNEPVAAPVVPPAHQEPKCCEGTMAGSHDPKCVNFHKSRHDHYNDGFLAGWKAAASVATEAPQQPKCVIGEYCRRHGFIHGAEAEELRERLEKLCHQQRGFSGSEVRYILDDVDARDSLAWVEHLAVSEALPTGKPEHEKTNDKTFARGQTKGSL